jgi:hypothetical protein
MCKIAYWSWESGFTLNTKIPKSGWTRLSVSMMVADEPNQRHYYPGSKPKSQGPIASFINNGTDAEDLKGMIGQ